MPADDIAVDQYELRSEAGKIDAVASAIGTARDAVASMNLGGGAFGLMCAFLVPFAQSATDAADEALQTTAAMVNREADALRDTADDFEATEEQIVQDLRDLGRDVEAVN